MKKRNLIVALSGMGALAVAVGAVGTAAWYSATNATIRGTTVAGSIASASSTAGLGEFTVQVTVASANPCLSDNSGNTYVTDGNNNIQGTSTSDPIVSPNVTLAVSYATTAGNGPETLTAAQIKGLWHQAVDGKTLTLTFTGNTPVDGEDAHEATEAQLAQGGIKFTSGSSDYEQSANDNVYTIAENDNADFEVASFSNPTGSKALGWASTATMDDGVFANVVFMGLKGIDNVFQDDWGYSYTFTAVIA